LEDGLIQQGHFDRIRDANGTEPKLPILYRKQFHIAVRAGDIPGKEFSRLGNETAPEIHRFDVMPAYPDNGRRLRIQAKQWQDGQPEDEQGDKNFDE